MNPVENLFISGLSEGSQKVLQEGGFDMYQHAFSAQKIKKDGFRTERQQITPIQFLISKYNVSQLYQRALDELLSHANTTALHNGPKPTMEYVLETQAENIELVKKIKTKSSSEDIHQALAIATGEQKFRSNKCAYYTYLFFEAINVGQHNLNRISLISDSQLTQLVRTLQPDFVQNY